MKKLFLIFCSFLFSFTYSQNNFIFNVELSDRNQAPTFTTNNGVLTYNGTITAESTFFANYNITKFYQTYQNYKSNKILNMFTFETTSANLINDILIQFPSKYLRVENLTGFQVELLYNPNDYGITSPVSNLVANLNLKSFDYINAPKAWDFFPIRKGQVTIGISDGKINNNDTDFGTKVTYLHETQFNSTFDCTNSGGDSRHGTSVGAIAAAQGDNAHGMTGICYDCKILNVPYTLLYNGLLDLANAGVKVINMSWINGYNYNDPKYQSGYFQSQQDIINELHNKGVVLIAGAGNLSTFYESNGPDYSLYCYPASYNHVISVTLVNAKNANFFDELTNEVSNGVSTVVSWYNEDLITPTGTYINNVFDSYNQGTTTNTRVDICGPGFAPSYSNYLLNCSSPLNVNATSASTPFVTGTVALMQSLNPCINPDEVEDVLQLSSKNLEIIQGNEYFIGRIGSGKLETGDAVEFVHEMMVSNGNALIDGQDFWRFKFDLKHINNKLTISNQIFRDGNTSNFTAKTAIDVIKNSDFKPNSTGFVDLNIDTTILVCDSIQSRSIDSIEIEKPKVKSKTIKLFPNPNKGIFTIMLSQTDVKDLSVTVFDILGKIVYETISNETVFDITISNLPAGLYLVKLSSNSINETLKFIKE